MEILKESCEHVYTTPPKYKARAWSVQDSAKKNRTYRSRKEPQEICKGGGRSARPCGRSGRSARGVPALVAPVSYYLRRQNPAFHDFVTSPCSTGGPAIGQLASKRTQPATLPPCGCKLTAAGAVPSPIGWVEEVECTRSDFI